MTPAKLIWKKAEDEVDETEQSGWSGMVEIGRVRRSVTTGRWRWEFVALPGMQTPSLDRRGAANTETSAKNAVEVRWQDWLEKAGLQL